MGASVGAYWPGIEEELTEEQLESCPGFCNGSKAWGNWMADCWMELRTVEVIQKLKADAILSFTTISTDYLQVASEINGITITQPGDRLAVEFERKFGRPRLGEEPEGRRLFAIESEGQRYHVIAARMWVLVRTHNAKSSLPVLFRGI